MGVEIQHKAMATRPAEFNRRILIVDDDPSIHADFRKILGPQKPGGRKSGSSPAVSLDGAAKAGQRIEFDVTAVAQGAEGASAVREAVGAGKPYAMAFVDMKMPRGWDGIETILRIWEADPDIQVVLCSARSDCSNDEIANRLGNANRLVILRKPFDALDVLQLASALTEKWAFLQWSKSGVPDKEQMAGDTARDTKKENVQAPVDVREHQRTRELLRATQEKLNQFLAKSPTVLYSFKLDGESLAPVWISANYSLLTGGRIEDWFQQAPALAYVVEADRGGVLEGLNALLDKDVSSLNYRIRCKDGQVRWIRDDLKLVQDAEGRPAEIIGCWTDITEQRMLQEQLWQAQKMESVGQLAEGVAHDFNNLLMVIKGDVELLLNTEKFKEPVVRLLRQVLSVAEGGGQMTQQLLAFSQKHLMQRQALELNGRIAAVGKLLGRALGEQITVKTRCADNLPSIVADQSLIDQVIMNLAINARDAMPRGGQLTISTSVQTVDEGCQRQNPDARAGCFVCLSVTDSGCGIAREHLPHLFEPSAAVGEAGLGTGLGLAAVHSIVKQHEGWVEVESQPGKGTTFRIFLPVFSAPASPVEETRSGHIESGGQEMILVVEDEPAVRGLVRTALQQHGYQVCTANSGAEALNSWAGNVDEIDLLITDVVMPNGISGLELAQKLQARKPQLKIVYMSGYNTGMTEKKSGAVVGEGTHFLQKPFNSEKLAEMVRACLDGMPPPR